MIKKILFFIFLSLVFCNNNKILSFMNDDSNWSLLSVNDNIKVYQNEDEEFPIIKVEKELSKEYNKNEIFDIILNVPNYNNVLTNRNLYSQFLETSLDTIYGYQKTYNYIPFTRNRHLIFKLYKKNEYKLEWKIINENNILYEQFKHRKSKELRLGAGSWQWIDLNDKNLLIHYLYIDPEIKLPRFLLRGVLRSSVIQIMDDVLNHYDKTKKGK
tara:strand:+ start:162 stop:803 length:642 start_codon:yes stop_codon:yes gene_type:complete